MRIRASSDWRARSINFAPNEPKGTGDPVRGTDAPVDKGNRPQARSVGHDARTCGTRDSRPAARQRKNEAHRVSRGKCDGAGRSPTGRKSRCDTETGNLEPCRALSRNERAHSASLKTKGGRKESTHLRVLSRLSQPRAGSLGGYRAPIPSDLGRSTPGQSTGEWSVIGDRWACRLAALGGVTPSPHADLPLSTWSTGTEQYNQSREPVSCPWIPKNDEAMGRRIFTIGRGRVPCVEHLRSQP